VLFEDDEAVLRVLDDSYTFKDLKEDVCRYFEVHPLEVDLVDDSGQLWDSEAIVREEIARFENQYGRVMLVFHVEEEKQKVDDELGDILNLLLGKPEEVNDDDEDVAVTVDPAVAAGKDDSNAPPAKPKINRRQLILEFPFFLIFFLLFPVSILTRRDVRAAFYQVNAIKTILVEEEFGDYNEKVFEDIRNYEEVWEWIEGVLIPGLYPDGKYNDDEFLPSEIGTIMMYNQVVGAVRFRQVRSEPNKNCPDVPLNKRLMRTPNGTIFEERFIDDCHFNFFVGGNEAKTPFGPGIELIDEHGTCGSIPAPPPPPSIYTTKYGRQPTEAQLNAMAVRKLCTAFTWGSADANDEKRLVGKLATYQGGGYVRDVENPIDCREREDKTVRGLCERSSVSKEDLTTGVDQLKSNLWLDASTRVVIIKTTFFNANLNFFMALTFFFEFTGGGTIVPTTQVGIVKSATLEDSSSVELMIELTVMVMVLYYLSVQIKLFVRTLVKHYSVMPYFRDVWNLVELAVLSGFLFSLTVRFLLYQQLYPDPIIFEPKFIDFSYLGEQYALSFNLDAICVLFLFFKMFKYAQLHPDTNMLWSVLSRSAADLGWFAIMLMIMLSAFGLVAQQMFGPYIFEYTSVVFSIRELGLLLLGQIDLESMQQAAGKYAGLLYFLFYIVTMFFIMMNIFLAILGEAYSVTRQAAVEEKNQAIKAKGRSLFSWIKLAWTILKARRMRQKKLREGGDKKGDVPPPPEGHHVLGKPNGGQTISGTRV